MQFIWNVTVCINIVYIILLKMCTCFSINNLRHAQINFFTWRDFAIFINFSTSTVNGTDLNKLIKRKLVEKLIRRRQVLLLEKRVDLLYCHAEYSENSLWTADLLSSYFKRTDF